MAQIRDFVGNFAPNKSLGERVFRHARREYHLSSRKYPEFDREGYTRDDRARKPLILFFDQDQWGSFPNKTPNADQNLDFPSSFDGIQRYCFLEIYLFMFFTRSDWLQFILISEYQSYRCLRTFPSFALATLLFRN